VYLELLEKAGKMEAAQFLKNLIGTFPYKIHTILTDNGIQFTNRISNISAFPDIFDSVCGEQGVEHRLMQPAHPWTNGQVERMNKTINEAPFYLYYYENQEQIRKCLPISSMLITLQND
jgi:transposase InsO family protein